MRVDFPAPLAPTNDRTSPASTASEASSYLWSTGATSQSIVASQSGTYTVIVTNANGCSTTSAATTVTANALPTATIALTLGIYAASNHNRAGDLGVMALSQVGIAIPNFWFAILLILIFSVKLQWFSAVYTPTVL